MRTKNQTGKEKTIGTLISDRKEKRHGEKIYMHIG